ncbi:MAG: hypothetical protein FWG70_06845 [Oscillospiraceae bacterium]|nr:hypothetical protein [Oscillospiraceae bacterium]
MKVNPFKNFSSIVNIIAHFKEICQEFFWGRGDFAGRVFGTPWAASPTGSMARCDGTLLRIF